MTISNQFTFFGFELSKHFGITALFLDITNHNCYFFDNWKLYKIKSDYTTTCG